MNAKKCDRCGKFYTIKEPNAIEAIKALGTSFAELSTPERTNKAISALNTAIDLCENCEKEFKKWLNEGEK